MRAAMGADNGAGVGEWPVTEVGRERLAKAGRGERGVARADSVAGTSREEDAVGVTMVERKALSSGDEWTVTGSSSSMLDGTSLWSIKLYRKRDTVSLAIAKDSTEGERTIECRIYQPGGLRQRRQTDGKPSVLRSPEQHWQHLYSRTSWVSSAGWPVKLEDKLTKDKGNSLATLVGAYSRRRSTRCLGATSHGYRLGPASNSAAIELSAQKCLDKARHGHVLSIVARRVESDDGGIRLEVVEASDDGGSVFRC